MINANQSKLVLVTISPFRRKLILNRGNYFALKTVKHPWIKDPHTEL